MSTGTARFVWGIVLTALLAIGLLRNLVTFAMRAAVGVNGAYLGGEIVGTVVVLLLVLVIRGLLLKGAAQRRACTAARTRALVPPFAR